MNRLERMNEKSVNTALFWLSAPAVVGLLIQTLYGIVDSIFVGHGLGEFGILGLSALTVAFPVSHLLLSVASGIAVGGSSYISRRMGSKDKANVKKGIGNMIALALLASVVCTVLGLIFLDPVLKIFGANENVLPFAHDYVYWIVLGCVFQILAVTINAVVMAQGHSLYSMGMYATSSVCNVFLDYVFIFEFEWGISGAAIATVLSQMLNVLVLIYYLYRVSKLDFSWRWISFDFNIAREMIQVGVSEFIRESSLVFMFIIVNFNLNIYGENESSIAIFGLINRIFGFVVLPVMGIVQGMIPLSGYNYGAKNYARVREIFKTAVYGALLFSFLLGALSYIFTAEIFALFTTDAAVIQEGVIAYWIADVSIPIVAFQIIGSALMQALGNARASFILTMARQVFILPVLAVIPYLMGLVGVWVAFPVVDVMAGLLTLWFVVRQLRSLKAEEKIHAASANANVF